MIIDSNIRIIIGLVGFRCCGKSTLRKILDELNYPVFNTNSVSTGDKDADQISLDEILERYGENKSYLLYIKRAIEEFVGDKKGILFIDSFKIGSDFETIITMFPNFEVHIWYLHASTNTRLSRYISRDVETKLRTQDLIEHDNTLERHGIWNLIKSANEIINMELELSVIRYNTENILQRLISRYKSLK